MEKFSESNYKLDKIIQDHYSITSSHFIVTSLSKQEYNIEVPALALVFCLRYELFIENETRNNRNNNLSCEQKKNHYTSH